MNLIYDGSLEGLFSVFYEIYALKIKNPLIFKQSVYQPAFFEKELHVETNSENAERVVKGIKKKAGKNFYQFFYAAHNDRDNIENDLFAYAKIVLDSPQTRSADYSNPFVLKVSQYGKSVGREKHRMEAFVRFRLTKDDIYFASIEPDFDVIPLIKRHFEDRYQDQKWLIYDLKRDYGIYYDLSKTERIQITFDQNKIGILSTSPEVFSEEEMDFQELWANYFKSTNIESRKNMKLHLQHVPKRYWKYLSEKTVKV